MSGAAPREVDKLLAALPLPALLVARDETILGINDRARALLGDATPGRHVLTILRQPLVMDAIEAVLRDRTRHEARYLGQDGAQDTTYDVEVAWLDLRGMAGALVSFQDLTRVEQANQMRRDFVANVSHELRTPLTALLGFVETLQGPARDDPAARARFLATMQSEASRMERLVRDLLTLSRVEGEERVRPRTRLDLAALVRDVVRSLGPLLESAAVRVEADLPRRAELTGDPDQLRQVVTNLVENAVKYGGRDRTIWISLTAEDRDAALRGPAVALAVRDEGPGIAPVHVPRLTERFYRVDDHRAREMGGTGLGLAIVKHIVNRHRGRLMIESAPGKGSEFKVILPL
ncbi:two-component sensor histidine kinase [Roseovarius sp. SCSIO 43702]|uniref:ATP-binding protein n=1 Tax=Roseovarius sp. SCSIO 43702 TaxID=2823043 RepID=UPI001C730D20|nr:ATP-binding protein [Roseovarius sp. SCSIO 43702]QYX55381.1 two-component sensor histidine kinase [Roseovarius sp. SCSIO 43702]